MTLLLRLSAIIITGGAASCAVVAGLDEFGDESPAAVGGAASSGGAGGASGGASASGGVGGEAGSGGDGGTGEASWGVTLNGEAMVTAITSDPATGNVWVVGLYRSLDSLPPPPTNAWSSFLASFAPDGAPLSIEQLAVDAGAAPAAAPVYVPDADVLVVDDTLVVATTSAPGGAVPLLGLTGNMTPFMAWGTLDVEDLTLSSAQRCVFSGYLKNVSLAATSAPGAPRAVAVAGGMGAVNCMGAPPVTLTNETLILVDSNSPDVVTPISNVAGVRSSPSVALLGNTRLITGHFDNLSFGSVQLCGNGMPPNPSCELGTDFGAFAATYLSSGGQDAKYVGSIASAFGGALGAVETAAHGSEIFVVLTERAATTGIGARDVRLFSYSSSNLESVFEFLTPSDEIVKSIALTDGRALLAGAVSHSFDSVRSLGGVVEDHTHHTGGCLDDAADIAGDAFWIVFDQSETPVAGAHYGDCGHQTALDSAFDSQGNVLVAGRFTGEMSGPDGEMLQASHPEGSLFIFKVVPASK